MGRTYAGILGPLGCGMILARGLIDGGGIEATLLAACVVLFVLAFLGYLAGSLADDLVCESVRLQFGAALKAWETQQKTQQTAKH